MSFVLPRQNVSPIRSGARWARRSLIRYQRDHSIGTERKWLNSHLNNREFWHGRTELESMPRVVQVGTNWTCNLKCNFCRLTMPWTQAELKSKPKGELQISDKVEAVVRELLPYAEMLTLTPLGEPLMWKGLDALLELHQEAGSENLALTTNGMLLTDKMAEKLVRSRISKMFLSIDSNDIDVYANMRVGGDLRKVEEGIRRVNKWKEKLGYSSPGLILNGTFMERNIHQLPSMVGWAKDLGFEEFSVQLMEIENPEQEGEFLGHHIPLAHKKVSEALAEAARLKMKVTPHLALRSMLTAAVEGHDVEHHGYTASAPNMPQDHKRPEVHGFNGTDAAQLLDPALDMRGKELVEKCHYPWYFLLIDTDGEVRPCCWADTSWGNLNNSGFDSIWNGPDAQLMRQRFLNNDIPDSCRGKHCRVDL